MKYSCLRFAVYTLLVVLSASTMSLAQYAQVYPTNWWVGMKWNKVQLLIKGDKEGFNKEKISINYPGVSITKVNKLDNSKYIFFGYNN